MSQYALMHKNDVCGSLVIDDETGSLRVYKIMAAVYPHFQEMQTQEE